MSSRRFITTLGILALALGLSPLFTSQNAYADSYCDSIVTQYNTASSFSTPDSALTKKYNECKAKLNEEAAAKKAEQQKQQDALSQKFDQSTIKSSSGSSRCAGIVYKYQDETYALESGLTASSGGAVSTGASVVAVDKGQICVNGNNAQVSFNDSHISSRLRDNKIILWPARKQANGADANSRAEQYNGQWITMPNDGVSSCEISIDNFESELKSCAGRMKSWIVSEVGVKHTFRQVDFISSDGTRETIFSDNTNVPDPGTYDPTKDIIADAAAANSGANQGDQTSQEDGCFRNGGATGWILCPIVNGASQLVETTYDERVEPLLQVNSNVIDDLSNPEGGTYSAWAVFRDFANIAFVILLLVVIFSQVTGYGIDNYGIKRILPKLVVTAVMVNLSFIVCRLAVDLSNILGMSLRGLMQGIASGIPQPSATFSGDSNLLGVNVLTTAVAALVAGGGALAAISAVMSSGWGVLLPLLLAGLSALIAVFFAFLILGIRQALVILLTAISPLAFVAYALPNTNNLFKKWFDAFKGVLLVYPICGLLVGAGDLAARILLSGSGAEDFGTLIIAVIVTFAPYFFIPSLLKKSLAAVGGLGDRLSALGRTARGTAGRLRGTDAYKRAQTSLSRTHGPIGARFGRKRSLRQIVAGSRLGTAVGWQTGAARANQAARRQAMEDRQATAQMRAMVDPNASAQSLIAEGFGKSGKAFEQAIDNAMYNDSVHAVDAIADELNGMKVFDNSAQGRANKAKLQALQARARDDSNFANLIKNRDRDAFDMIMDGGASGQPLSHYSAALKDKMADGDWATQKAGTLQRAAAAGGLTSDIARHLATSEDESLRGLQTDPGTRDVLQATMNEGANAQAAFQAVSNMTDGGKSAIGASANEYRTRQAAEQEGAEFKIQHDQAVANQRARYEGMSDDEVLDIATSPNASMTEQKQAEVEYRRRTEPNSGGTPTPPPAP